MRQVNVSPLTYYAGPGSMTDLKELAPLFDGPPAGISQLVEVVQGLMIHPGRLPLPRSRSLHC
jgi:hypothetical protein